MYRLLVVDDEPDVVEGLYNIFSFLNTNNVKYSKYK